MLERYLLPRKNFSYRSNFLAVSPWANKKICCPREVILHFPRKHRLCRCAEATAQQQRAVAFPFYVDPQLTRF